MFFFPMLGKKGGWDSSSVSRLTGQRDRKQSFVSSFCRFCFPLYFFFINFFLVYFLCSSHLHRSIYLSHF